MTQSVNANIRSEWAGGFVADFTVSSTLSSLDGWTVSFDAPFELVNVWNARIISHIGTRYVLGNLDYNGLVPAGGSTSFGFQAAGASSQMVIIGGNGGTLPMVPTISISDASLAEPLSGSATATLTVTLSQSSTSQVTVGYATANGTALAGIDYSGASGTLIFAPGQTSKAISINVLADGAVEGTETVLVNLTNPSGASIADAQGVLSVLNTGGAVATPTLSVSNIALSEPGSGSKLASFAVNLSTAASGPVEVNYFTADGTARAGQDYIAISGTLTFAAGETSKLLSVAVLADSVLENAESFVLNLTHASGAVPPSLSATATITEPAAGSSGYLSTQGNQIINSAGTPVQINATSWFGGESTTYVPHGLWARSYKDMMDQMVELGFNAIRLPYSTEAFQPGKVANGIDFAKNPDLQGLSVIQIYDKIVDYAGQVGLKIFFDHHRSEAGAGPNGNGLWYTAATPEAKMIETWEMLATRYGSDPTVIGADLHNEPHNATWGDGSATDWRAAAQRIGNAILAKAPDWLIIVEGTGQYQGSNYWWGGNLEGVRDAPVVLNVANKLVYSPHDYPNSVFPQPWFSTADFPNNLDDVFREHWGYIFEEGIAPILLGEWGSKLVDPKDAGWLSAITKYLGGDFDQNGSNDLEPGELGMSWAWWAWNPNSGDTGGVIKDDWTTPNLEKIATIKPIMFGLIQDGSAGSGSGDGGGEGNGGGVTEASFASSAALAAGSIAAGVIGIKLTGDNLAAGSLDHLTGLNRIELSYAASPVTATFASTDANAFVDRIIHVSAPNTQRFVVDGTALGAEATLRVTGTHEVVVYGGAGDDLVIAGDGSSMMHGNAGNDRFVFDSLGTLSTAQVVGGVGTDTLELGAGISTFANGAFVGKSTLEAIIMNATGAVSASLGSAAIGAFSGQLVLSAPHASSANFDAGEVPYGTVVLHGTAGSDTLVGGAGDDWLLGGGGGDRLRAGNGQDTLVFSNALALAEAAEIDGGLGFDTVKVEKGNTIADAAFTRAVGVEHLELAGGGVQTAILGDMAASAFGGRVAVTGPGATSLVVDAATMSAGAVDVYGTAGADDLRGGFGGDLFRAIAGGDAVRGGDGNDSFQFATIADFGAKARLDGGASYDTVTITGGGILTDVMFENVSAIERLVFDLDGNALVGSGAGRVSVRLGDAAAAAFSGSVLIQMNGGALTIDASALQGKGLVAVGSSGEDVFVGSTNDDMLTGGTGNDTFVFSGNGGLDRIEDWHSGDLIVMQELTELEVMHMLNLATEANGTTQLIYAGGASAIFLTGVIKATLTMNDFAFGQ